jgi:virulence factor Mce-like protein
VSALTPVTGAALARRRTAGVAFLVVLAMLVWLSVLFYQKAFTPVVRVTLMADHAGNQLSAPADVKLRGLVVGEVRGVHSTGRGATVDLALDPTKAKLIPSNVLAQLLPKTLFGEKYVELVLPTAPSPGHLRSGDVIPQDHSVTAMETAKVLDDLLPLLQTLKPTELSATLNALSAALRNRGDRLGATFARTGTYLHRLNPSVPTLGADLQGLADFSNNLDAAAPALLTTFDNLSFSSRSLVSQRAALDTFLASTGTFAQTARDVVARNEANLTELARVSRPSLELLARYSPEFPCFLKALTVYEPTLEKSFGGTVPGLHITMEAVLDHGGYVVGQEPKYRDTRPPYCDGLPTPRVPAPETSFDDGYRTSTTPTAMAGLLARNPALAAVSAPLLGMSAAQVPDVVGLLLGPIAEGTQVGLS